MQHDPVVRGPNNGQGEAKPPTFPTAIVQASNHSVLVKMPPYQGAYRLFAHVSDGKGGAAVANIPLWVEGGIPLPKQLSQEAKLPPK